MRAFFNAESDTWIKRTLPVPPWSFVTPSSNSKDADGYYWLAQAFLN